MGVWNIEIIERRPWKNRKKQRNRTVGSRTSVVLKLGLEMHKGEWDEKTGRRINKDRLGALFEKPILKPNTVYSNDRTLNRTCYKRKYK